MANSPTWTNETFSPVARSRPFSGLSPLWTGVPKSDNYALTTIGKAATAFPCKK